MTRSSRILVGCAQKDKGAEETLDPPASSADSGIDVDGVADRLGRRSLQRQEGEKTQDPPFAKGKGGRKG